MNSSPEKTSPTGSSYLRPVMLLLLWIIIPGVVAEAQYFGRNKPSYRKFEYDVVQTPNFELYHYMKNDSLLKSISRWSENWYSMHQAIFRDTFLTRNPLIFYTTHADFQQTNTISSLIGTGTGGVTESLKNRVIMPVASSLAQTDHTLGHELVHAFQYNLFLNPDTMRKLSINNVPLWMIEGMAEYLSIGSVDPNTSIWMRDAILSNDFPTLKQLSTDSRYFPYRWGQSFWAMAGKTWGDTIIMPLLKKTAELGFNEAAKKVLGHEESTISALWKLASEEHYKKYLEGKSDSPAGRMIVSRANAGETNISPSISPDGKYLAFFSEKDLFTLDLFLADARTGKIIKKLSSVVRDNEIDDFNFIESAGTWSPDDKKFAFVVFSKGVNKLAILDVARSKITREYRIPGVQSFSNPAWSPDGGKIVVTGQVDGISDLYLFDLNTFEAERLTGDFASNIHPAWSPDGKYIVYSQERINDVPGKKKFSFDIAVYDLEKKTTEVIDLFGDAFNLNPCFSPDGKGIFFLSDADGFRNLYKYELENDRVYRLTDYARGISGITAYSPAISVPLGGKLIAYNYYRKTYYEIWTAEESQFERTEVDPNFTDMSAATLPPLKHDAGNIVDKALFSRSEMSQLKADSMKIIPYKSRFKLDYISNSASVGLSTGIYRNGMAGSVNAIFSDMVGNNQLFTSLNLNGEIYDFGGQVAFINQKGKVKWGGAVSHVPYLMGGMNLVLDTIPYNDTQLPVYNFMVNFIRMFEDNISLFASYPLSQTRRFESQASSSWYYYRFDRYNYYYTMDQIPIGGNKEKLKAPKGDNFQQVSLAYVEDNSYFGMTAPMQGHRARLQLEKYFGAANIFTTLADYRKYFYARPATFAVRLYNYGMFGKDAEDGVIMPFYLGYPWLVRGYENVRYDRSAAEENSFDISWLSGTRIVVGNAELRFPFSGPERLALIKSKFFLADINLFVDAGLAWSEGTDVSFNLKPETLNLSSIQDMPEKKKESSPLISTGASVRVNVMGYIILEPYVAVPFQNGGFKNIQFGLNFTPGW